MKASEQAAHTTLTDLLSDSIWSQELNPSSVASLSAVPQTVVSGPDQPLFYPLLCTLPSCLSKFTLAQSKPQLLCEARLFAPTRISFYSLTPNADPKCGSLLQAASRGPWNQPLPSPEHHAWQACDSGVQLTWRKTMEVSVQYRCISSPPCNTTAEPACTAPFFLSLSHRRCLFRANSASGTFRVSFPREKEGLQRHKHRPVSISPHVSITCGLGLQGDSGQPVVSRPMLSLLGPRDNPSLSQPLSQPRLVHHTSLPFCS